MHDSVYFLWVGGFVSCQCRWRGSSTLFTLPDQQPQYRRTSSYRFSTFPFPTLHQCPLTINYTSLHLDRFPNSLSLTFIISCQCSVATNNQINKHQPLALLNIGSNWNSFGFVKFMDKKNLKKDLLLLWHHCRLKEFWRPIKCIWRPKNFCPFVTLRWNHSNNALMRPWEFLISTLFLLLFGKIVALSL